MDATGQVLDDEAARRAAEEAFEKGEAEWRERGVMMWWEELSKLWIAVGIPVDPVRLAVYGDVLKPVPLGLLELAVAEVLQNHEYSNVPQVAEIWKVVRKLLGNPRDVPAAIEAWLDMKWSQVVYRFED